MKKLYLLTQNENMGYDTYDSCVVCAKNKKEAKYFSMILGEPEYARTWVSDTKNIKIKKIGTANDNQKTGIVLQSFNAG